ncbi:hypothetical protein RIF23_12995 [Lipingzhangella sp. LS1_29]|uniref:Uncharacterized protein n=1 Tax=Lipingzhangella rawalii TaxID=2055835 RepID=A0ABU2H7C2_9ACTN|nr:DUF6703 family protein [Lipingzhangella rawalii]MDS1271213.1 hypothetical protein [Lipingzhangella rawalii]
MFGNHRRRPPRPLPSGDTFYTPNAGALRTEIERRSATVLVWLHQAPAWLLPVTLAGLLLGGLLVSGIVGALLLTLLALAIAWLAFLAWPRLDTGHRTVRCLAVGILAALATAQTGLF